MEGKLTKTAENAAMFASHLYGQYSVGSYVPSPQSHTHPHTITSVWRFEPYKQQQNRQVQNTIKIIKPHHSTQT